MKAKRAWIVRWDASAGSRDGVVAGQILTFLDPRYGDEAVIKIMKALWISHSRLMWRERLSLAIKPSRMTSNFVLKRDGEIFVGVKPRLVAKIVNNVEAIDTKEEGIVRWVEFRETEKHFEQSILPLTQ